MKFRKKLFLIVTVAFLVLATVLLLVGGYMAGWDIVGWFSSKWATYIYFGAGLYLLYAIYFLWKWLDEKSL